MSLIENTGKIFNILMVEDNPDDVELTRESLKDSKFSIKLDVACDGIEALNYLKNNSVALSQPDLILLDLNLPRMDGREVLQELKEDPDLKRIPVVVLTTSQSSKDIQDAYDLHANCYITKPLDIRQFHTIVKTIEDFWLTIVKLPKD